MLLKQDLLDLLEHLIWGWTFRSSISYLTEEFSQKMWELFENWNLVKESKLDGKYLDVETLQQLMKEDKFDVDIFNNALDATLDYFVF